ncbi:Transcriptional regulator GlxA family, contains an amidase domain and an AraC-type DNA-binding HTH domain [Asanoa hainanensis]|uniref:Transcriptional regulator GlxA family, contains an amidase domain and an AraC-type DNA-binding HTH domain n=1 Tax=Asanoa hainanensis TaxID=560556 RepID=A0A239IS44_9ACTN|nr:DJ-1/PfpI family protein [Asanoa hainanensis]SNS96460.1 Transcriptional regulator GlxA family, contains an amidase domain and an AraC-type DNA-binding HTH domain [Asanoa hainanensis]
MEPRHIVMVGYDGAELLDIACVTSTFGLANAIGQLRPGYRVSLATPGGHPIRCDSGLVLQAELALERLTGPLDTVIVSGGFGHEAAADNALVVAHVRRLARESRRIASVCTGATVLAATGLLDGHRATTHWRFAPRLASRYRDVRVDPAPIFIREGRMATAAGVTSGLDLTLAFVEEDHGPELSRQVARDLVTYLQRPGNQAQMSVYVAPPAPENDLVRRAVDHVVSHLDTDLSTARLADAVGVSARHLTRLFLRALGDPPARFVRAARVDAAARLLDSTDLPMPEVAARTGFGSVEALRQAFVVRFGMPPAKFRAVSRRPATDHPDQDRATADSKPA